MIEHDWTFALLVGLVAAVALIVTATVAARVG